MRVVLYRVVCLTHTAAARAGDLPASGCGAGRGRSALLCGTWKSHVGGRIHGVTTACEAALQLVGVARLALRVSRVTRRPSPCPFVAFETPFCQLLLMRIKGFVAPRTAQVGAM